MKKATKHVMFPLQNDLNGALEVGACLICFIELFMSTLI